MNTKTKIFFSIALLVITLISYGLPDVKEFTKMCNSINQEGSSKKLLAMLKDASKTQRLMWISKFNHKFNSPIVYAVFNKNIPIIKVIINICLQDGISYHNFTTIDGTSMLTLAVLMKQVEIIHLLLDNDHPLNKDINYKKSSALHEAAKLGYGYICQLLAQAKGGRYLLHTKDYQQKTPINYLIEHKKEKYVLWLLHFFPVNVNDIPLDDKGMSYLHYAIIYDLNFVVRKLLEQGIDPNQKTLSNIAPIDLYSVCFKTTFYIVE
jgi:ankyrin repeat protein